MSTFIIVIAIFAIMHSIYDGIVLPSIRMHLRNRLFILRDEIRKVRGSGLKGQDEKAFWLVHDGINNLLNKLSFLTVERKAKIERAYNTDTELQKKINSRIEIIENCDNEELKNIFHKSNDIIEKAFIANAGGWFIYLVPIALLFLSIKKLSLLASELIVTPTHVSDQLIPQR